VSPSKPATSPSNSGGGRCRHQSHQCACLSLIPGSSSRAEPAVPSLLLRSELPPLQSGGLGTRRGKSVSHAGISRDRRSHEHPWPIRARASEEYVGRLAFRDYWLPGQSNEIDPCQEKELVAAADTFNRPTGIPNGPPSDTVSKRLPLWR
jgi:hypothetical protein